MLGIKAQLGRAELLAQRIFVEHELDIERILERRFDGFHGLGIKTAVGQRCRIDGRGAFQRPVAQGIGGDVADFFIAVAQRAQR